jgi:hypothetical protein
MKKILAMMLIFFSGVVVGIVGHDLYMKYIFHHFHDAPPEQREDFILKMLTRELDLTQAQLEKIKPIVLNSHSKIMELNNTFHPKMEQIINATFELIRKELNESQQKKLDMILTRMKKHDAGDRPPPPPPFPYER